MAKDTQSSRNSKARLVIGLMSGTSLDGIHAVLLRVHGSGVRTEFKQLAYIEKAFPRGLKRLLLRNSQPATSSVDDIARLNMLMAHLYAEAAGAVAKKARIPLAKVDLIGSHGQTIRHLPQTLEMFGRRISATLQIGDPSVIATLTGVTTVGNFRPADMAVGGQGAPLVPYLDWLVFRSRTKNRVILNIGGIANVTLLPKRCLPGRVLAFDTGPGNMVIDALARQFYGRSFDREGKIASSGWIIKDLFRWMTQHAYLKRKPPKSTGREMFGEEFVKEVLKRSRWHDPRDVIATATQFTAYAVYRACGSFGADEVIVSGGGARNGALVAALRKYFGDADVRMSDEYGISSDAKEAICFALLANETIAGNPANLPSVTGATKRVILGSIARPQITRK